jgi:two-component system, chemotaxis family, chemotaxis protein CheY
MTLGAFTHVKALIVEDNHHMRVLLRSLLNTLGITHIYEASDGAEAFALLRDRQPDLVLTDLTMHPIDGISFVRELRQSPHSPNPYIPVVMVTGHTERRRVETARDAGVTEFLAKPISAKALYQRILNIVINPRPFIKSKSYFGPDRRRNTAASYAGAERRKGNADVIDQQSLLFEKVKV